jgi:PTS system nitrogen regulatory IIA component
VHTIFATVTPTIRVHLQLLSRLSYGLHDDDFKAAVARRAPDAELVAAAERVDRAVAAAKARVPDDRDDEPDEVGE